MLAGFPSFGVNVIVSLSLSEPWALSAAWPVAVGRSVMASFAALGELTFSLRISAFCTIGCDEPPPVWASACTTLTLPAPGIVTELRQPAAVALYTNVGPTLNTRLGAAGVVGVFPVVEESAHVSGS